MWLLDCCLGLIIFIVEAFCRVAIIVVFGLLLLIFVVVDFYMAVLFGSLGIITFHLSPCSNILLPCWLCFCEQASSHTPQFGTHLDCYLARLRIANISIGICPGFRYARLSDSIDWCIWWPIFQMGIIFYWGSARIAHYCCCDWYSCPARC